MSTNTPSDVDDLLPCPFCGGEPFGHAIEAHEHSAWLKSLEPDFPDHQGSYVIECGCGAGHIDDTQELCMARWNRRTTLSAAQEAPADPSWWRKRADEIEAQVARTGSTDAMRCFTDMRTLLQAATTPFHVKQEAPTQASLVPMAEPELRELLGRTNHMVSNAMHGPFWPELEEACRAVERHHGITGE